MDELAAMLLNLRGDRRLMEEAGEALARLREVDYLFADSLAVDVMDMMEALAVVIMERGGSA